MCILGVDMIDCAYSSMTAIFGMAFSDEELLKLKLNKFKYKN